MTENNEGKQSRVSKKQKLLRVCLSILIISAILLPTAYAVKIFSSRAKINNKINTGNLNSDNDTDFFSFEKIISDGETLSFKNPGDSVEYSAQITNTAKANMHYYFGINYKVSENANDDIAKAAASAILVYFDGEFIDTLANMCSKGNFYIDKSSFLMSSQSRQSDTHTISFKLHISAPAEYLDNSISVNISAYSQSADYEKYIFVTDEEEFKKAIDDINSGMLPNPPSVVLVSDITLTDNYSILYPFTLNLFGNQLIFSGDSSIELKQSGEVSIVSSNKTSSTITAVGEKIILNSDEASLNIDEIYDTAGNNLGINYYSKLVKVTNFNKTAMIELIKERFSTAVKNGITNNTSLNPFGSLDFILPFINISSSDNNDFTYADGIITTKPSSVTKISSINIEDESVEFKIVGDGDYNTLEEIFQNELLHLEHLNSDEAVTRDLFLPTAIKDKNITITWKSSNERQMSSNGRIDKNPLDSAEVILYAEIRINNSVYLRSYTFNVTIETNSDKFRSFAAQIHPTLSNYYAGIISSDNKKDAEEILYYLPVYDPNGKYHYTKSFVASGDGSNTLNWDGYNDIGLSEIWYEPITTYTYVSLYNSINTEKESAVYLNTVTFNTFAQITVKGKFEGDETVYESEVNITINLGTNSGIFDLVFSELQGQIDQINVLQNILDTRASYGWGYERGDFFLTDSYMSFIVQYDMPDDKFSKELLYATDNGRFSHDTENQKYHIGINADKFSAIDSTANIKVTVTYDSNGDGKLDDNDKINNNDYFFKSDLLTFKVPGIIKADANGFSNLGVFLSAKYQVYNQVNTAPVIEGLDKRIEKLPPITIGTDKGFIIKNNALRFSADEQMHSTGTYILLHDAGQCSELSFIVGSTTQYSEVESDIYQFSELLAWATGNSIVTKTFDGKNYTSDGKYYLSESEAEAIKIYFQKKTKASDEQWNTLWNEVSEKAPGYVLSDGQSIIEDLRKKLDTEQLFKYLELLQWATDAVDWHEGNLKCPNMGVIGNADWKMNISGDADYLDPSSDITKWTKTTIYGGYEHSKYHTKSFYDDDNTTYISNAEAQIILAFLLNNGKLSGNITGGAADKFRAALSLPTLLHDNAAETLIAKMYELTGSNINNISLNIQGNIPLITNLDGIDSPISRFTSLTSIEAKGIDGHPAFIQTSSVSSFLNRLTTTENILHSQLKTVVMQYCAIGNTTLNLSSIGQFSVLENFDISGNSGIGNIANIIDLNMETLRSINISGVNVSDEFLDFPLSYINLCTDNKCEVKYKDNQTYTNNNTTKLLANLNRLSELRGNYLQLCKIIYDENGTEHNVIWHIESGNPINRVTVAGNISEISSEKDLLDITANYYYCSVGFTYNGKSFNPNRVYKMTCNKNGEVTFTDIGFEILTSDPVLPTLNDKYVNENVSSWKQQEAFYTPDTDIYNVETEITIDQTTNEGDTKIIDSKYTILYGSKDGIKEEIASKSGTSTLQFTLSYTSTTTYDYIYTYNFSGTGSFNESFSSNNYKIYYILNLEKGVLTKNEYKINKHSSLMCNWNYSTKVLADYETLYNGLKCSLGTTEYNLSEYDYIYFTNGTGIQISDNYYIKKSGNNNPPKLDPFKYSESFNWSDSDDKVANNYNWEFVSSDTYASYVASFSTDSSKYTHINNITERVKKAASSNDGYFIYTGNNGTFTPYTDGYLQASFTYRNNSVYKLSINANGMLSYNTSSISGISNYVTGAADTNSMDKILKDANAVLGTSDEIKYYGNYYYYTGDNFATVDSETGYIKNGVYRLLKDENGKFCFVYQRDCTSVDSSLGNRANGSGTGLLTDLTGFSDSDTGKIYYLNNSEPSDTTFKGGEFYSVIHNELTGIYYLKTFGNVSFSQPAEDGKKNHGNNQRLKNDRPFDGEARNGSAYGGTGGTYNVTMSATIVIDGVSYTRMFNVSVFGG